jgi:glycogen operon protein
MWFDSTGAEMTNAEWSSWFVRVLGMLLSGATMDVRDPRGRPIQDGTFLVMLNAYWESVPFILPGKRDVEWELIIDTSEDDGFLGVSKYYASSAPFDLGPRSLGVFGLREGTDAQARAEAWQTAAGAAADSGEAK